MTEAESRLVQREDARRLEEWRADYDRRAKEYWKGCPNSDEIQKTRYYTHLSPEDEKAMEGHLAGDPANAGHYREQIAFDRWAEANGRHW